MYSKSISQNKIINLLTCLGCSSDICHTHLLNLVGDGHCDDTVNTFACNYDNGDCCLPNKTTHYCTNCSCLGQACHIECNAKCLGIALNSTCIKNCLASTFNDRGICKPCNENCIHCDGTGANCCIKCKHVKDGDFCMKYCPDNKYKNKTNNECHPCHATCTSGKYLFNYNF